VVLPLFFFVSDDCFIYGIASESGLYLITSDLNDAVLSQLTVLGLHFFLFTCIYHPALGASNMTQQIYLISTRLASICRHPLMGQLALALRASGR